MSSTIVTSSSAALAVVLTATLGIGFAACNGSENSTASSTTGLTVSAQCSQAEDDCRAAGEALAQKTRAQAQACSDAAQKACSTDPSSDACKQAKDSCMAIAGALKGDVDALLASCGMKLDAACASSANVPAPGAIPDAGSLPALSQACKDAVSSCQSQADALAQKQLASADACRTAAEAACQGAMPGAPPSDACKAAIQGCIPDATALGQKVTDLGQSCVTDVTKACGIPTH